MNHDTELEDFHSTLKKHGHSNDNFEVSFTENPIPADGSIHPLSGSVTIKSTKSGVERVYTTGHGTSWVVEFDEDLRTNVFA